MARRRPPKRKRWAPACVVLTALALVLFAVEEFTATTTTATRATRATTKMRKMRKRDEGWFLADPPEEMPPWRRSKESGFVVSWHDGVTSTEMLQQLQQNRRRRPLEEVGVVTRAFLKKFTIEELCRTHRVVGGDGLLRSERAAVRFLLNYTVSPTFSNVSPMKFYLHHTKILQELEVTLGAARSTFENLDHAEASREAAHLMFAATFATHLQAIHPFQDRNKRVWKLIVQTILRPVFGYDISLPVVPNVQDSLGYYVLGYVMDRSLQLATSAPGALEIPVLNSSLFGAFILDCAADSLRGLTVDRRWEAIAIKIESNASLGYWKDGEDEEQHAMAEQEHKAVSAPSTSLGALTGLPSGDSSNLTLDTETSM